MVDPSTSATCAHCGVLVDIYDGEAMTIFLSEMSAFVYHGWCFEPALERVVIIMRPINQEQDQQENDRDNQTEEADTDGTVETTEG